VLTPTLKVAVAVSLPKLTASTILLCSIMVLVNGRVVVHMGKDE
jgi:hypothetical protein